MICLVGLAVLLSGCATGNADEARQYESQEAERVQKVPAAQSTQLAESFMQSTGTPEATLTPNAGLSELMLASSVGSNGEPTNQIRNVPAYTNQTIYAVARIADLQPGSTVTALWRDQENGVLFSAEVSPAAAAGPQWIDIALSPNGAIGPGVYSVAIQVNGEFLESIAFQVT